jgi:dTDP-4-dehydro-6-deoxy-alpha-D-glucopyranose 2,3-dehydratase
MGCRVEIGNREVVSWDQPMVRSAQEGLMGFIVKKINGIYHFLVQAKLESGNFDIVEMAPTVQCLTGNYRKGKNEYTIPYLEQILNAPKDKIWYSSYQSEEGGRFFQEQNLNIIVEVGEEFPIEVEENYCWLTLNQMLSFVTYNNYLNIAARSLLSAISFY